MSRLIIRHVGEGESAPRFVVVRTSDHLDAAPVEVFSPVGFPVEGQGQRDLMQELRWYLEGFLDYPFEPSTVRAERLLAARQRWGRAAFDALFHGGLGRDFYSEAIRDGEDQLVLEIRSNDPRVLSWPWEALESPKLPLACGCQIERRLTMDTQPPALAEGLPRDRLRILLVIARPFEVDVGFRSIARPLVEQIEAERFPAEVTVLRPPTFERLQEVLEQNPGMFHILHFDGHGGYGSAADGSGIPHQYKGPEGRLVFEDARGKPAPVEASKLSALLARYKLPAVVLNACQSAMLDERAEGPFASVAAALLRGGVRSVVAMAYSLYVSAAQVFLPAFYKRLFETGDIGRATQDGRRRMFDRRERVCVRGQFPLEDWLIPVLYQQAKLDFGFVQVPSQPESERAVELPQAARDTANPYGFVGRDSALLTLERAMRRKPAGILVHGLGGVGKTTLARGFVNWLAQTHGLGAGVLWVDFRDVRSGEFVVNAMLGPLAGTTTLALPLGAKLERLTRLLRKDPLLVVWDNFESARGIEGNPVEGSLSAEDQQTLAQLLERVRGGKSKVLLSSRSEERWLGGPQTCTRVRLGGLSGEERWAFCQVILDDLGLVVNRQDPDQVALMDKLGGHPLLMRAVLPKLESMTARAIAKAVESNLAAAVGGEEELGAKVLGTLAFVEQSLPKELVPLLVPLSLHEHFVMAGDLEGMGANVPGDWNRGRIDALLCTLTVAGLVTRRASPEVFELHPALTTYLRARVVADGREDAWKRSFVGRLGTIGLTIAMRPAHDQQYAMRLYGANLRHARALAKRLNMKTDTAALTQVLAVHAMSFGDFAVARQLFEELAEYGAREGKLAVETAANLQLGVVALRQRDFKTAERWYLKSLVVFEEQGDERGVATTCRQLGKLAQEQQDFTAAEDWFRKALIIFEAQGYEIGVALIFHHLGMLAQSQRDYVTAEAWYWKAYTIYEKQDQEDGAAVIYHHLGTLAQEQRDFEAAERWYLKSLAIQEMHRNAHGAASTLTKLGRLAQQHQDFEAAERWYLKCLAIYEKEDDEHGAAQTYHRLGIVAQAQRDFEVAERWYLKCLAIYEKQGDERGVTLSCGRLGDLTLEQRDFEAAERWYLKSLAIYEEQGNEIGAARTHHQLGIVAQKQRDFEAAERWYLRSLAIYEKIGDEHGTATICHLLGTLVAEEQRDFEAAERWYLRSLDIYEKEGDEQGASLIYHQLGILAQEQRNFNSAKLCRPSHNS